MSQVCARLFGDHLDAVHPVAVVLFEDDAISCRLEEAQSPRTGVVKCQAVVVAHIVALSLSLCRVVQFSERLNECFGGDLRIVIDHLDHFGMVFDLVVFAVCQHLFVGGIGVVPTGVSCRGTCHTPHIFKVFLHTLEASGTQDNGLGLC